MIKVTIIALAKLKEKYFREAAEEYKKRLSRFCKLDIIEIEPERLCENPSRALVLSALSKEAESIRRKIPDRAKTIALCVEGKEYSSEALASLIKANEDLGRELVFIIGSSYGLDEALKSECEVRLSVSPMTFPHQLFRIVLLEQIYRGFMINSGSEYHK